MALGPIVKSALVGAGASLLGSAGSAVASAKAAKRQMDFQKKMSNTAYQRATKDLEKAGLNRILALGSPASTPGGAMAQVPDFGSAITHGASTGIQAASSAQSISVQQKQANKIVAETEGINADNKRKLVQSEIWETIGPMVTAAAGNMEKLIALLADPEQRAMMGQLIKSTGQDIKESLLKVLEEQFSEVKANLPTWRDVLELTPIGMGVKKFNEYGESLKKGN